MSLERQCLRSSNGIIYLRSIIQNTREIQDWIQLLYKFWR